MQPIRVMAAPEMAPQCCLWAHTQVTEVQNQDIRFIALLDRMKLKPIVTNFTEALPVRPLCGVGGEAAVLVVMRSVVKVEEIPFNYIGTICM